MAWAAAGPSATAFAYGGQRGRSNNWWFSVGQILYEWQEQPQEQQPTKNGGITEFLEVWILWMCCFFSENGIPPIDIIPISVWR